MGVSVPPPRYAGDGIAHVNASDGRPGCDTLSHHPSSILVDPNPYIQPIYHTD